jgi:hypothetical protein
MNLGRDKTHQRETNVEQVYQDGFILKMSLDRVGWEGGDSTGSEDLRPVNGMAPGIDVFWGVSARQPT